VQLLVEIPDFIKHYIILIYNIIIFYIILFYVHVSYKIDILISIVYQYYTYIYYLYIKDLQNYFIIIKLIFYKLNNNNYTHILENNNLSIY